MTLHVPQFLDPDGIETSHVRTTAISLPEGMTLNPAAATGLQACTDAQLALGTHDPVGCPAASRVGAVTIVSPALPDPLTGDVWVGQPRDDDPYRIFLRATGPSGLDVRLKGSVRADATTGRLTATFADTPQVPFSGLHADVRRRSARDARDPARLRAGAHDERAHPVSRRSARNADVDVHRRPGRRRSPVRADAVHAGLRCDDELRAGRRRHGRRRARRARRRAEDALAPARRRRRPA